MPPRIPTTQLVRARAMRSGRTLAEARLWRGLRERRLGATFRRQVPIGAFIADFVCLEARRVVEVDGPSHDTPDGKASDARRDRWLRENGWRVARVSNELARAAETWPSTRSAPRRTHRADHAPCPMRGRADRADG